LKRAVNTIATTPRLGPRWRKICEVPLDGELMIPKHP
jgi:hypothetical protein